MDIAAKLDDWGKPAWITVVILGFLLFWPIGLAILAYLIWSGRIMARWTEGGWRRWGCDRAEQEWRRWRSRARQSSGNSAFDEYREETLKRLEGEHKEFQDFLDQLRRARDKAEFDQFMAERRRRGSEPPRSEPEGPGTPPEPPQGAAAPA